LIGWEKEWNNTDRSLDDDDDDDDDEDLEAKGWFRETCPEMNVAACHRVWTQDEAAA